MKCNSSNLCYHLGHLSPLNFLFQLGRQNAYVFLDKAFSFSNHVLKEPLWSTITVIVAVVLTLELAMQIFFIGAYAFGLCTYPHKPHLYHVYIRSEYTMWIGKIYSDMRFHADMRLCVWDIHICAYILRIRIISIQFHADSENIITYVDIGNA